MSIVSLKEFTTIELIHTLMECAQNLERAYQETQDRDYWRIALQAESASEFLKYEISEQIHGYSIH